MQYHQAKNMIMRKDETIMKYKNLVIQLKPLWNDIGNYCTKCKNIEIDGGTLS